MTHNRDIEIGFVLWVRLGRLLVQYLAPTDFLTTLFLFAPASIITPVVTNLYSMSN